MQVEFACDVLVVTDSGSINPRKEVNLSGESKLVY